MWLIGFIWLDIAKASQCVIVILWLSLLHTPPWLLWLGSTGLVWYVSYWVTSQLLLALTVFWYALLTYAHYEAFFCYGCSHSCYAHWLWLLSFIHSCYSHLLWLLLFNVWFYLSDIVCFYQWSLSDLYSSVLFINVCDSKWSFPFDRAKFVFDFFWSFVSQ